MPIVRTACKIFTLPPSCIDHVHIFIYISLWTINNSNPRKLQTVSPSFKNLRLEGKKKSNAFTVLTKLKRKWENQWDREETTIAHSSIRIDIPNSPNYICSNCTNINSSLITSKEIIHDKYYFLCLLNNNGVFRVQGSKHLLLFEFEHQSIHLFGITFTKFKTKQVYINFLQLKIFLKCKQDHSERKNCLTPQIVIFC